MRTSSLRIAFALVAGLACAEPEQPEAREVPVVVGGVVRDAAQNLVLLLEDEAGERVLPIWIGSAEAHSIAAQLEQIELPRPNAHDLARSVVDQLGAELVRVVVTELRGNTYFAVLILQRGKERIEVDSRPSDAIAIALRAQTPIFVRDELFKQTTREALLDEATPRVGL
jgi:bifunctional DNase/RNase